MKREADAMRCYASSPLPTLIHFVASFFRLVTDRGLFRLRRFRRPCRILRPYRDSRLDLENADLRWQGLERTWRIERKIWLKRGATCGLQSRVRSKTGHVGA